MVKSMVASKNASIIPKVLSGRTYKGVPITIKVSRIKNVRNGLRLKAFGESGRIMANLDLVPHGGPNRWKINSDGVVIPHGTGAGLTLIAQALRIASRKRAEAVVLPQVEESLLKNIFVKLLGAKKGYHTTSGEGDYPAAWWLEKQLKLTVPKKKQSWRAFLLKQS